MELVASSKFDFVGRHEGVVVTDDLYYDLMDRWAYVDCGRGKYLFVKHCLFNHPIKNRRLIMQVFLSNFNAGKRWEGVYEGRAILGNWVSMEYSNQHQMEIPKINLCNGNFSPTELEYDNAKFTMTYLSVKNEKLDPDILYKSMMYYNFVTESEFMGIKNMSDEMVKNILPIEIE